MNLVSVGNGALLPHKPQGFTLTEIAIVLSVIGIVIGAIWSVASNVHETQRQNDAVTQLQTIEQNMRTLMSGRLLPIPQGDNDITSSMISAGVIPNSYVDPITKTSADNPWNNGVATVHADRGFIIYTIASNDFRLSFYNVSYGGCVNLLLQGTSCQFGQADCPFDVVVVAGGTIYAPAAPGNWATAMSVKEANTLCAENNYTGGANSVEFDYHTQ